MLVKRALVVDDSKSGRVLPRRAACRKNQVEVDSAETAEQAIEYLHDASSRCDLHGSPDAGHGRLSGRAGHQERSTYRGHSHPDVPSLQEGELYLGQARAAGCAMGAAAEHIAGRCAAWCCSSCSWSGRPSLQKRCHATDVFESPLAGRSCSRRQQPMWSWVRRSVELVKDEVAAAAPACGRSARRARPPRGARSAR